MKKIFLSVAVFAIIFALIAGCAVLQAQVKVSEPDPILLTELFFQNEVTGIVGPGKFGDFSVTHDFAGAFFMENGLTMIMWVPSEGTDSVFSLYVKNECPEAVALEVCDVATEKCEYFIYDSSGIPHKANKEAFDAALALLHTCPEAMIGL